MPVHSDERHKTTCLSTSIFLLFFTSHCKHVGTIMPLPTHKYFRWLIHLWSNTPSLHPYRPLLPIFSPSSNVNVFVVAVLLFVFILLCYLYWWCIYMSIHKHCWADIYTVPIRNHSCRVLQYTGVMSTVVLFSSSFLLLSLQILFSSFSAVYFLCLWYCEMLVTIFVKLKNT